MSTASGNFDLCVCVYVLGYELNVCLPDFQSIKFETYFPKL